MGSIRISAVVVGVVVDVVLTLAGGVVLGFALAARASSVEAVSGAMGAAPALAMSAAIGTSATILGGYVAARVGGTAPLAHGAALGVVGIALGLLQPASMAAVPEWFRVAGLVSILPAALVGAAAARRTTRCAPAAMPVR